MHVSVRDGGGRGMLVHYPVRRRRRDEVPTCANTDDGLNALLEKPPDAFEAVTVSW